MDRSRPTPTTALLAALLLTGLATGAGPARADAPGNPPTAAGPAAGPATAPPTVADPAVHDALVAALRQAQVDSPNAPARHICYATHVAFIGWQKPVCDGRPNGTEGQSRAIQAIDIIATNTGGVCADANVQSIGWQGWRCGDDGTDILVGTTGQSLQMEALAVSIATNGICADAYVQDHGWLGFQCAAAKQVAVAGTTGQGLRMEAVEIVV
ncbi:hypothetical protein AB0O91_36290 [Kitasatospora sp. NPDC089797]|uniref:hypothetical protein n=1 Tax=Kitasatospora sp. NPDC089797 TaxID=3155298 RepID=UPI0034136634